MDEKNQTLQKKILEQTQPITARSRNNLTDYIRSKNDSWSKSDGIYPHKDYFVFHDVSIFVQEPLPSEIDLNMVLQTVESVLPQKFIETVGLEMIMIGQFPELVEREIQSMWKEGTVYVTNEQSSNEDMIDDLVHEIAHAVEDTYGFELYADDLIEQEFLLKRRHLYDILSAHGYTVPSHLFMSIAYSKEFDEFLHKEVGYEKLNFLTMGLFVSAYAATSVREYFASGFEEYFLPEGDRASLMQMSPTLYQKIEQLMEY